MFFENSRELIVKEKLNVYFKGYKNKTAKVRMSRKEALSQFINQIHGRPVVVKLNSGVDYRGWNIFHLFPNTKRNLQNLLKMSLFYNNFVL